MIQIILQPHFLQVCKRNFWKLFFFFLKISNKKQINPKKILKMYYFQYQIGLINLPSITKVMENQNFCCVYLGTMILCL